MRTKQYSQQSGKPSKWHKAHNFLMPIAAWAIVSTQLVFAGTPEENSQFEAVLWPLSAMEGYRFEKQICEENYPEFKDRNEAAFRASHYSRMTGEELIKSMTTGETRQKLLTALPELRADIRERYTKTKPQFLKSLCSSYAADIIQQSTRNSTAQPAKP